MKLVEDLNTRQLLNYAKDNGYNTTKFMCSRFDSMVFVGEFLDAYYEFIKIPVFGEGFVRIQDIEEELGYDIKFDVLSDDMYNAYVSMDFMMRGLDIPDKYKN